MNRVIINLVIISLIAIITSSCGKQVVKNHSIAFYNVENLFDTINSPDVNDESYTPQSELPWNTKRYTHKLDQLSKVINAMDTVNAYPIVIGLCEIENESVLKDLANRVFQNTDLHW